MTSWVVADASLILASVLPETHTSSAQALTRLWEQQEFLLTVPFLFYYELVAAVRKHVYRGTVTVEEGVILRDRLLTIPSRPMIDESLLARAFDLASELNRPTAYDSQYLAVAERLHCAFWTADERLYNAVHEQLDWVHWIGNFEETGP